MKKKTGASGQSGKPSPWLKEKPVGEALRNAYKDVLQEPVPPRLKKLVDQLREEERKKRK